MLFPLFSAVSESFATIIDKFTLNISRIDGKNYTSLLFIFMGLFGLSLLHFSETKPGAFTFFPILALLMIIAGSAVQNVLFYVGLKSKNLSSIEPIRNSEPILVILLAFLFFPSERNILVLILGAVTSLAIAYSHLEKNEIKKIRIVFDGYACIVLLSMLLAGMINIGYRYILDYYSPVSLYAFRAAGVGLILFFVYRPSINSVDKKQLALIISSALFYSAAAIFKYIAISRVGLSTTILILTLSPALIYFFSRLLLNEKLTVNRIFASIAIVSCVIIASIYI